MLFVGRRGRAFRSRGPSVIIIGIKRNQLINYKSLHEINHGFIFVGVTITKHSRAERITRASKGMYSDMVDKNGRTVRTWVESRGHKTLTRKFFVDYQMTIASVSGIQYRLRHTKKEMHELITKIKATLPWHNSSTWATHLEEFKCIRIEYKGRSYSVYVSEKAGDLISEVIA